MNDVIGKPLAQAPKLCSMRLQYAHCQKHHNNPVFLKDETWEDNFGDLRQALNWDDWVVDHGHHTVSAFKRYYHDD